jgi:hypothetical protein
VAGLVFGSFAVTLDVDVVLDGQAEVRLSGARAATNIIVTETSVSVGDCSVARVTGGEIVTLERRGSDIMLGGGDTRTHCIVSVSEHVSLAVIASQDTTIGSIHLQRL